MEVVSEVKYHPINTNLADDTPCVACESGSISEHELEYFTKTELEAHIALTEAYVAAKSAHEALRRAAAVIDVDKPALLVAVGLQRAVKLVKVCRHLGAVCDEA